MAKSAERRSKAEKSPELQLNLAVVSGVCSAPPEVRVLESGTRVASLSVRAPVGGRERGAGHVGAGHRVGPARLGGGARRR